MLMLSTTELAFLIIHIKFVEVNAYQLIDC